MTAHVLYSFIFGIFSGAAVAWLLLNRRLTILRKSREVERCRAERAENHTNTANTQLAVMNERVLSNEARVNRAESDLLAADAARLATQGELRVETARANEAERELAAARMEVKLRSESLSGVQDELEIQTQRANITERRLEVVTKSSELHENESRYHKGEHAYYKELSKCCREDIEALRTYLLEFDDLLTEAEAREALARLLERLSTAVVYAMNPGQPAPHRLLDPP